MGMYTEIYINADLKENTPAEVINTLKAMCEFDRDSDHLQGFPNRWAFLFGSGSYYTPNTSAQSLTFDDIGRNWSIIGKGDIKNYDEEIQKFFDWIKPWCEDGFIGYHRYEEQWSPTLVFKGDSHA